MRRLLTGRLFPDGMQWTAAVVFVATIVGLLFGPADGTNPANLLVWVAWWPLLCVLFLVAGRVWCSVCPFPLVGRLAQGTVGLQLPVPDFLKRNAGWLITFAFFLLCWMEELLEARDSPRGTAVVLLGILTGAFVFGLFFRGRAWCRTVCPLGGISLVYARTALWKVRASEAACAECQTKDCVVPDAGYAGCPMHLTPFAIETVSSCSFCGSCVRRCTNQSLRVTFESPSLDLSGGSSAPPVVVWLTVLLAGELAFLDLVQSPRLPFALWLRHSTNPVLLKTLLVAACMAACWLLFEASIRLAAGSAVDSATGSAVGSATGSAAGSAASSATGSAVDSATGSAVGSADPPRERLLRLGALPMIPLLLFVHLGHLSDNIWANDRHLIALLADVPGLAGLRENALFPAAWTGYFNPSSIVLGLAWTLSVSRWALKREPELPAARIGRSFALLYALYACWNLFTTWPAAHAASSPGAGAAAAAGVAAATAATAAAAAAASAAAAAAARAGAHGGWEVLWPFVGINAALLALAAVVGRSERQALLDARPADFSASRSWSIRDRSGAAQAEILEWLLEQAVQARWRIPPVVGLANAGSEIVAFLQRTLPDGSPITVHSLLRRNKGVLSIFHEGRPLTLPEHRAVTSLDDADDAALDGLELRLAGAQVEQMSYQARLSDSRCCFTLRQPCPGS